MPYIKMDHLSFCYKTKKECFHILNDINIEFETNKIHVIIGKSGAGKTTLLKCITGLKNYEGHILFDDIEIDGLPIKERNIGYVNQEFALYPHMDLFSSISYPLKLLDMSRDEIVQRVHEIAKAFDIDDVLTRKPKQVSIGQAQRSAIARALIKRPSIVLMDEPLSNVDNVNRSDIRMYLKNFFKCYGTTAIYVTHDLKEATALADYIYLMDEGKIVASGSVNDILYSKNKIVRDFFAGLENETM